MYMSSCSYAAAPWNSYTRTSTSERTGLQRMDWFDSLRNSLPVCEYDWSITMRKRQKEYHAAHGNGTAQPDSTPGLPTMEVEPLPDTLTIKLAKETSSDHDWHI